MDFRLAVSTAVAQVYTGWVQVAEMAKWRSISKTNTEYEFVRFEDKSVPDLLALNRAVPPSEPAVLETIFKPRIGKPFGPRLLIARDGTVSLDGARIHHVLFVDVEVHYSGKPTDLQDVAFRNCRFLLDNAESSRMLALEILSSGEVTFTTSA
jgi:hypothetical protein